MYRIIGGDGKEYGPVSAEQIQEWFRENRVNFATRVRAEEDPTWKTLADFPELRPSAAAGAPPAVPLPAAPVVGVRIANYLWQSIAVTVCCCLPFGIPAIIFASQVNTKMAAGDLAGAQESSRKARLWCWLAFGVGLLANLITVVFYFLAGLSRFKGF